jgi:transcriptional regulator with PAS, ATPase and Fis domain
VFDVSSLYSLDTQGVSVDAVRLRELPTTVHLLFEPTPEIGDDTNRDTRLLYWCSVDPYLDSARERLRVVLRAVDEFQKRVRDERLAQIYGDEFVLNLFVSVFGATLPPLLEPKPNQRRRLLVRGKTGTGKERISGLIATCFSMLSTGEDKVRVVNAAQFAPGLLDAELFGYEKGAFTGADKARDGYVGELDDGATLVFDEIGEADAGLQARLLRFLETDEYQRVGSSSVHHKPLNVVGVTNREADWMQSSQFRADLYYRLAQEEIQVPSLKDIYEKFPSGRRELAKALYGQVSRDLGHDELSSAEQLLSASDIEEIIGLHSWPGNLRQCVALLKKVAVRNALRGVGWLKGFSSFGAGSNVDIARALLGEQPSASRNASAPLVLSLDARLEAVEEEAYREAWDAAKSVRAVAERLHVTYQTALRRLDNFNLREITPRGRRGVARRDDAADG